MKKHLIGIALGAMLVITGCGNEDAGQGQEGTTNRNIEPVRYKNHDNDADNRNYTLQRGLEETRSTELNTRYINNNRYDNNDNRRNGNQQNQQNHNRYDVAEEAADLIVKRIKTIDNAYVLTTGNNAYVAANLDTDSGERNQDQGNNGQELTDDVKKQISDIVKSVDSDVDQVYVSTNPDFMDLANNYANDMNNGEPIEGFFEQIGTMIERVFPQNNNN